jgi:hypothetical protein
MHHPSCMCRTARLPCDPAGVNEYVRGSAQVWSAGFVLNKADLDTGLGHRWLLREQ